MSTTEDMPDRRHNVSDPYGTTGLTVLARWSARAALDMNVAAAYTVFSLKGRYD